MQVIRECEAHLVNMYRGFAPHANADDGNRFADKDDMVKKLRQVIDGQA